MRCVGLQKILAMIVAFFIKDLESGEVVETGYAFLEFGSIDSLLDELPEITE